MNLPQEAVSQLSFRGEAEGLVVVSGRKTKCFVFRLDDVTPPRRVRNTTSMRGGGHKWGHQRPNDLNGLN